MARKKTLFLFDYAQARIEMKKRLNKASTAELYQVAVGHFLRFAGDPRFRMEALSRTLVVDFIAHLQNQGLAVNTVNSYVSSLRAIYNAACHEGLIASGGHPFEGLNLRRKQTAKRAVPVSTIHQLAAFKTDGSPEQERAVDIALFSFLACGMPFVDIAYLTTDNIRDNLLVYNRRKTGAQIRLEMTAGMWQLVRKYESARNGSRYLFPILPPVECPTYGQYKSSLAAHNRTLKEIGIRLGTSAPLTSYVMRHSWASAALKNDVPVSVISQALGHSSEKTTRCYLSELDVSELARANRKVSGCIDLLMSGMGGDIPYL